MNERSDIDVNAMRMPAIALYDLPATDEVRTFYYDETNNHRLVRLTRNGLNVPEPRPFVLGGIVHGGDPRPIDLSPLRADLRIQASVKELKFEHIAWGDFPAILGSRRLAQFLSWLKAESYLIHFIAVDPLYFAFVDIIDSIPEARRLDFPAKLILKNDLYRVLRHDGEATLDLLRRYAFPAVDSRNVPRFMTELITLLEGSPELMPAFNQMMLKGILQAGRGLVSLPLLDDAPHVLMAGFDSMFTHRLCLFKASHHLLDDEDVVSKVLERYRFHDEGRALDFYRFVNSVKRRSKGTPDRRRRGTPFSDNMMLVC